MTPILRHGRYLYVIAAAFVVANFVKSMLGFYAQSGADRNPLALSLPEMLLAGAVIAVTVLALMRAAQAKDWRWFWGMVASWFLALWWVVIPVYLLTHRVRRSEHHGRTVTEGTGDQALLRDQT